MKKIKMITDTPAKEKAIATLKMRAKYLNNFIDVVEVALKRSLTETEKLDIYNKGFAPLEKSLKHHFQFPDATDEFNYQSMGIDIKPIKDYFIKYGQMWSEIPQSLVSGKFVLQEKYLLKFGERFDYYTENAKQKKKFTDISDLCELLNNEYKSNGINTGNALAIVKSLVFVGWSDKKQKYIPNIAEIRAL